MAQRKIEAQHVSEFIERSSIKAVSDFELEQLDEPRQRAISIPRYAHEPSKTALTDSDGSVVSIGRLRYEVLGLVGQGGMGSVYKAKGAKIDSTMAIKFLRPELVNDATAMKRFEQEVKAASGLTHPNLAAVYDHGRTKSGAPFLVMDYVQGENLAEILNNEGALAPERALGIFIQVADALAHAHRKGVIHRDIKPSNIIVTGRERGVDFVKIVDFGIAKIMPSPNSNTNKITQTAQVLGSPAYMSPEQCLGQPLDARSDIYSLGCVMYETVTGSPPFIADNAVQMIVKQISDPVALANVLASDSRVMKGLGTIIERAVSKQPDRRYQSMNEIKTELMLLRSGRTPHRRVNKVALFAGVGSLCVSIILGLFTWHYYRVIQTPVEPVEDSLAKLNNVLPVDREYEIQDLQRRTLFKATGTSFGDVVQQAIKQKVNLSNANLSGTQIGHPNGPLELTNAQFAGASFVGADLSDAVFTNCNFAGSDLTGASLSSAKPTAGRRFKSCNFKGANLTGANIFKSLLKDCNFDDATMKGSKCSGTSFESCTFNGANLKEVDISQAQFEYCKLAAVTLAGAYFKDSRFNWCYLNNADLTNSFVGPTIFTDCNLTGMKFAGSNVADTYAVRCTPKQIKCDGFDPAGFHITNEEPQPKPTDSDY